MLGIKSQNESNIVYETDTDFYNFALKIYRQVWNNSLPLEDAVKVSISKDNVTYTPVVINDYIINQKGADTYLNVYNKTELEEGYKYIKIEFSHHNGNLWELAISKVELQGKTNDQFGPIDRTKPSLFVTWNLDASMELNAKVNLPVATATDDIDQEPTISISVFSPYNSKVSVTNNQFMLTAFGQYRIIYKAEDKTGNFIEEEFTIDVIEPVDEEISGLSTKQMISIIAGSVAGLAIIGAASFFLVRKFKK